MAKILGIVIVDFEGAVVDVTRFIGTHEESVVVHEVLPAIDVGKDGHVFLLSVRINVKNVAGNEVKISRVELDLLVEVGHAKAKVAELLADD